VSPAVFSVALVVGAASLALWTDVRFPGLAPASFTARIVNAAIAALALTLLPTVDQHGSFEVYTAFTLVIAGLCYAFLTGIWLLRALQAAVLRS
jgi:hypothetical protein